MWPHDERLPPIVSLAEAQANGLRENRRFKDVPCMLLFFVVLAMCTSIIAIALTYGDPDRLLLTSMDDTVAEVEGFALGELAILASDYKAIVCALLGAAVVALVWFQLFKHLTMWMVYGTLGAAVLLLGTLGGYLYFVAQRFHSTELLFLAVLFWLLAIAALIVGIVVRHKVEFTAVIVTEAGSVLQANPSILGVVGITFLVYAACCALWVISFLYLYTVPSDVHLIDTTTSTELLNTLFNANYRALFWLLLLGACWITPMIFAIEQYIIASITLQHLEVNWGLRRYRNNITAIATREAFTTSFGSLALGSSLVGVAYFLNIFRRYIASQREFPWKDNWIVRLLMRFGIFLIEVVSDFAFIYVALTGSSFVSSSRAVMDLLRSELAQSIVMEIVLSYLLLMGQLAGTAIVTLGTVVVVELLHSHVGIITVLAIALSTFFLLAVVSKAILVTANTMLVFVLQDLKEHGANRDYKSPSSLRNLILAKLVADAR